MARSIVSMRRKYSREMEQVVDTCIAKDQLYIALMGSFTTQKTFEVCNKFAWIRELLTTVSVGITGSSIIVFAKAVSYVIKNNNFKEI